MTNAIIKTNGMHCTACEMLVKEAVEELAGIQKIKVDHKTGIVEVVFDDSKVDVDLIKSRIDLEGYEVE